MTETMERLDGRVVLCALAGAALVLALPGCGDGGGGAGSPEGPTPTTEASRQPAPEAGARPQREPAPPPAPPATSPPAPSAGGGAAAREAAEIFASRCATCHGAEGRGDGLAAADLNPRPRNFHDPAWQQSVTDDHIRKIIVGGGPAVGRSPLMPPNPDLASRPEVVDALVAHIRALGAE